MIPATDKYTFIAEIASGQLTKLVKARHNVLNRDVLLKILHKHLVHDEDISLRFKREAQIAASIDHPNVVSIYDCGEVEGSPFIAMEWIEGENLFQYINRRTQGSSGSRKTALPINDVLAIIAAIMRGLNAIHKSGVIHRDLKPDNVMINHQGDVKLTDFSLAFSGRMTRITQHGDLVGSPAYIAPEVISGEEPSPKSDIFAAGLILWELLTGENPFETDDIFKTLQNAQEAKLPDIDQVRPGLSQELKSILYSLLARNPSERPDSADEVFYGVTSLEEYPRQVLQQSPSRLRIPTPPPAKRAKTEGKLPVVIFIVALIVALFIMGWFWIHQDKPIDSPQEHKAQLDTSGAAAGDTTQIQASLVPDSALNQAPHTVSPEEKSGQRQADESHTAQNIIPQKPEEISGQESPEIVKPGEEENIGESPIASEEEISYEDTLVSENIPAILEGNGFVDFTVYPWARIYIDGQLKGDSPLGYPVEAACGEHWLVLDNPYFPRLEFTFSVTPEETLVVQKNLFDYVGQVKFNISPWGYITIDSTELGTSPLPRPIYLTPGEYLIHIEHPNFPPYKRNLMVRAGENISLVVDLTNPIEIPAQVIEK